MVISVENSALLQFLKNGNPVLFAKVLELRNGIQAWLGYIPETFPHYTRHTVQHSDAIIQQMSSILFFSDTMAPTISLSAMEAYIAAASAYLHDAGMVCSDSEKLRILRSDDWKDWTTNEGAGAKRYAQIEQFRRGDLPADSAARNFIADLQLRFLLAEYIRRLHASRGKEFIVPHQASLGGFTFGDPILARTLGDVCEAHGLSHTDLDDRDRFPDRRDIQGSPVNVRFLAVLLRIGDLLDLSYDRACPLLLNAACPLPAESLAHWTQYQRVSHRVTAPDRIEITAQCENQEEHRFLKDWCRWLVNEIEHATILMTRSA
ncbi:MAG: HD domain-containing protein, partial [Candidatus Angelobacter sp.]